MIEKFKQYFKQLETNQNKIIDELNISNQLAKELEWAHIYHDSIRGKKWLENLPINVGRWAGNYSFFYILNRILNDYQPKKILELGLGESTKIISAYIDNFLTESIHTVFEQNEEWALSFCKKFPLSKNTKIEICPPEVKMINNFEVISYQDFNAKISGNFDLYLIDGPYGSNRFSRYDIIDHIKKISITDEFILLFDDTNRQGEYETCEMIKSILTEKNIKFYSAFYSGVKGSTIIATEKYKYSTSF